MGTKVSLKKVKIMILVNKKIKKRMEF